MQSGDRAATTRPFGVILAGGLASRMGGGDKALIELAGMPMLGHVIARLTPQVAGLALNANGDPGRFAAFGLKVLADPVPGYPGPLAGVLAGMDRAAREGASHVVTAAADTPFLPTDLVVRLMAGAQAARAPIALAATASGLHPTFGLWAVSLHDDLRQALGAGTRKAGAWALERGAVRVPFETTPLDPFFNINTPQDLAEARARLTGDTT